MRYFTCLLVTLCITTGTLCAAAESGQQPSTSEKQQVNKQGTQNPEAYELYLKGRSYWDMRTLNDLETAVSYFNQAIAKDPSYAMAYAGLADAYAVLPDYGGNSSEDIPKTKAAALKAIELDATLGRPHAALGYIKMVHEWDFAAGEAEFQPLSAYESASAIASCYAELGDKEQAFRWLDTAFQEHDVGLMGLKTDYSLDPLRSDPRFAELVRKVGLPQ